MKPCPKCGSVNGFIVRGRIAGAVEQQYSPDGMLEETNLDSTYFTSTNNTVRCIDCLKIRRDVYLFENMYIKERR